MSHHRKHRMPPQLILITLTLAAVVVLTAIAGTRAWLYYHRELGTMTKIHFSELELTGTDTDTVPINLGEINMKETGLKEMPFRVHANPGTKYILQLGYTNNLPLTYEIFTLDSKGNQNELVTLNSITTQTYSAGEKVQQNAYPEYLQSDARVCSTVGQDDYILVVSWTITEENKKSIVDKDTEMIYLTAGIGGYETNETSETTQATP